MAIPRNEIRNVQNIPRIAYARAAVLAICLGGAAGMVFLSGMVPPLATNSDWLKHYAIFDALSTNPWPVILPGGNGAELLRYSIGWYLIPSLVATQPTLQWIAAAWTVIGLFLALCLLVSLFGWSLKAAAVAVPFFLLFGGADIVGLHVLGSQPKLENHYEWWAEFAQYTGHATAVFWVPQHIIPAWICGLLAIHALDNPTIVRLAGPLLVAVCLWSPFVAVGAVPLFLVAAIRHGWRASFSLANMMSTVSAVPVVLYLTASTGGLPHHPAWMAPDFQMIRLITFWLVEFLVLFLVTANAAPSKLMGGTVLAMLLVLPLYRFGIAGDLTMRASGPLLAVLAFMACRAMLEGTRPQALVTAALLGIGVAGQTGEIARGFHVGRVDGKDIHFHEAMEQLPEYRDQYLALLDGSPALKWLLR